MRSFHGKTILQNRIGMCITKNKPQRLDYNNVCKKIRAGYSSALLF